MVQDFLYWRTTFIPKIKSIIQRENRVRHESKEQSLLLKVFVTSYTLINIPWPKIEPLLWTCSLEKDLKLSLLCLKSTLNHKTICCGNSNYRYSISILCCLLTISFVNLLTTLNSINGHLTKKHIFYFRIEKCCSMG